MSRDIALINSLASFRPFVGLVPFSEADSRYFFGRDEETAELLRLMERELLTVFFGLSGLGKTSLLHAGLFPRLREMSYLPIPVRVGSTAGGSDVLDTLKARIHEVVACETAGEGVNDDESLWEYFQRVRLWSPDHHLLTPVLVFDQFEELFTVTDSHDRIRFLSELGDLIENHIPERVRSRIDATGQPLPYPITHPNYHVIITLREDFLPRLEELRPFVPSILRNRLRLGAMTGTQAFDAVVGAGGDLVEGDVAEKIVRFVGAVSRGAHPTDAGETTLDSLNVDPALLSLLCRELNEQRLSRGVPQITTELLADQSGRILNDFYEQTLNAVSRSHRTFIEERLLTSSGFRGTVALDDAIQLPGVSRRGLDTLIDRRLLRVEQRLGIPHIELAHDVLAPIALSRRGKRRQQERRRKRYGLAGAALLACVAVGGWWIWQNTAERERRTATTYAAKAKKLELAGRPDEALYRLAQAIRRDPTRHDVAENLLELLRKRNWLAHRGAVVHAEFLPDGLRIVTASRDGTARVWDARSLMPIGADIQHGPPITVAALSTDGRHLALGSDDGRVSIWDLRDRNADPVWLAHGASVNALEFSPDRERLLAGVGDWRSKVGYVQLWNPHTGEQLAEQMTHGGRVGLTRFIDGGRKIVSVADDGTARIWDGTDGSAEFDPVSADLISQVAPVENGIHTLEASGALGQLLFDGTYSKQDLGVTVTSAIAESHSISARGGSNGLEVAFRGGSHEPGSELLELLDSESLPHKLIIGPDERVIAVAAGRDVLVVELGQGHLCKWGIAAQKPPSETQSGSGPNLRPKGSRHLSLKHPDVVRDVRFSPDGLRLLVTTWEGAARIWNRCLGLREFHPESAQLDESESLAPDGVGAMTALGMLLGLERFGWDVQSCQEVRPNLPSSLISFVRERLGWDFQPCEEVRPSLPGLLISNDTVARHVNWYLSDWTQRTVSPGESTTMAGQVAHSGDSSWLLPYFKDPGNPSILEELAMSLLTDGRREDACLMAKVALQPPADLDAEADRHRARLRFLDQMVKTARPWIGWSLAATNSGLSVSQIDTISPAAYYGLQRGDRLTAIDGQVVSSEADVNAALDERRASDWIRIGYRRGKRDAEIYLRLAHNPADLKCSWHESPLDLYLELLQLSERQSIAGPTESDAKETDPLDLLEASLTALRYGPVERRRDLMREAINFVETMLQGQGHTEDARQPACLFANIAWDFLLLNDPTGAIEAAEATLSLGCSDPVLILIARGNLLLGRLLTGELEMARDLVRMNATSILTDRDRLFGAVVLEDLQILRSRGIENDGMAQIEADLRRMGIGSES